MNRKNLTAAVLAGLAGAAGIAGTAQAVNMNPDGLGQVLLYPYYTSNGGNQTILSVVNTTDNAKAVKVRFLEGFNSREVLDFNLYLSPYDVWAAAIADDDGTATLYVNDDSCTVPYLYDPAGADGVQPFLKLSYNDVVVDKKQIFSNDGGPTGIDRAAEGHFEMIEMGTIVRENCEDDDWDSLHPSYEGITFCDITHRNHWEYEYDDDGFPIKYSEIEGSEEWYPGNCGRLVDDWTRLDNGNKPNYDLTGLGWWIDNETDNRDDGSSVPMHRNTGGLFGGAAIVNSDNGTMYSYNAHAIQSFDDTDGELHQEPGDINPSLNDGSVEDAWVFFGTPQNEAVNLSYGRGVDAVSAVFMHEFVMNEYTTEAELAASTEWVVTFPTKNWYVDGDLIEDESESESYFWQPVENAPDCGFWEEGDDNPAEEYATDGKCEPLDPNDCNNVTEGGIPILNCNNYTAPGATKDYDCSDDLVGWDTCLFVEDDFTGLALAPFTELFDGEACEAVELRVYDRDERTYVDLSRPGTQPPVVSPSVPGACDPATEVCKDVPFELCYEVNVLRFNDSNIFSTPNLGTEEDPASLLITVTNPSGFDRGWAWINMYSDSDHQDSEGLKGLPATGFAAYEFENEFLGGGDVKAFYGGLFGHKGTVSGGCTGSRCQSAK